MYKNDLLSQNCFLILATNVDFYTLLSLSRSVVLSPSDVKQAYHRKLLETHPDKVKAVKAGGKGAGPVTALDEGRRGSVDIALLKEAFLTLSDPILRRKYDSSSKETSGPRPAEVISLDDFSMVLATECHQCDIYSYPCRCGSMYRITEEQLEKDIHLIGCEACSEVVWVGYEAVEGGDGSQVGN